MLAATVGDTDHEDLDSQIKQAEKEKAMQDAVVATAHLFRLGHLQVLQAKRESKIAAQAKGKAQAKAQADEAKAKAKAKQHEDEQEAKRQRPNSLKEAEELNNAVGRLSRLQAEVLAAEVRDAHAAAAYSFDNNEDDS